MQQRPAQDDQLNGIESSNETRSIEHSLISGTVHRTKS